MILKPNKVYNYLAISLVKGNKVKTYRIHRLVAQTFIPNLENKPQVNHKDGNRQNNCVDNLEWCTAKENIKHSYNVLHRKPNSYWTGKYGKNNPNSKQIYQIDRNTNEIIKKFYGINEANRETKINRCSIYRVCNNKSKTAGGYKWCYVENYNTNYNK